MRYLANADGAESLNLLQDNTGWSKFTQDRASSTDLFQPDLKEALPRPPRPPVMSRARSPLCTTSARGTSSSSAPLALMTVPGGTYTPQQLVVIRNATN